MLTFEDDDLFDRKPYAEFLAHLVISCDLYRRNDDSQSYTIALDSPWGTGKSTFLKKFESLLEKQYSDRVSVVHYNAWQNDFWDNAFEPLADAIFTSGFFDNALYEQASEATIAKSYEAIKHIAMAFTKKPLELFVDLEELDKAQESASKALHIYTDTHPQSVSTRYRDFVNNISILQDALTSFFNENNSQQKLLVVIDELDRCRPTFAIDTLEIVKHIMDAPQVVFIFALDINQLNSTIKSVYGNETDSVGYLMRFFSYYSRMPNADLSKLVDEMILKLVVSPPDAGISRTTLKNDFVAIVQYLSLSARDLETVCKVYLLMQDIFISRYRSHQANILYWLLLCTKYKSPIYFSNILSGKSSNDNLGPLQSGVWNLTFINDAIECILLNRPLKDLDFRATSYTTHLFNSKAKIIGLNRSNPRSIKLEPAASPHTGGAENCFTFDFNEASSLSGFIYLEDLSHWDDIKNSTAGEFLLKKMEMFNFIHSPENTTDS